MISYDIAVVFYILSFMLLLMNFHFNKLMMERLQMLFLGAGVAVNLLQLVLQWHHTRAPFYTIHDLLILVTFSLGLAYIIMHLRYGRGYLGLFLLPVIIVTGLISLFLDRAVYSSALESMWLSMHIPLAVIGTAFFLTAFASGIMYFILERQLKRKKFGKIFDRFPSLAVIDKINNASLYLGFAFYTAGILAVLAWMRFSIAGHVSDLHLGGSFIVKITLVALGWVTIGVILLIKSIKTTTARQAALASVIGAASVLLMYVGVVLFAMR